MKKLFFTIGLFIFTSMAFGQVGINNQTPQATLDVAAKTTDGSKPEGIIAPRLTGDQIKAGDAQYTSAQTGTLVYATAAVTTASAKTVNITAPGYYYFDGTVWQSSKGSGSGGGTTVTADNGLTKTGDNVQLGGSLIKPTTLTTTAANQLTVNAPTTGGLKYVDGNQLLNRVLTSDVLGNATWQDPNVTMIGGDFTSAVTEVPFEPFGTSSQYTGGSITLPKGKWLITFSVLYAVRDTMPADLTVVANNTISSSQTNQEFNGFSLGFNGLPVANVNNSQSITGNGLYSFTKGFVAVNVTADSVTLYVLKGNNYITKPNTAANVAVVPTYVYMLPNNSNNYIYAVKVK